jgi:hypothetical protein
VEITGILSRFAVGVEEGNRRFPSGMTNENRQRKLYLIRE